MDDFEQQMISLADRLRRQDTLAEAQEVLEAVEELRQDARALDSNDPKQWALRQFYMFLDAKSHDAVVDQWGWLRAEHAEIERELVNVLVQVMREETVAELTEATADLDQWRLRAS